MNEAIAYAKHIEEFVRDSETLAIIRRYVKENKYIDKEVLCTLLGIKKEGEE